MLKEIKVLTKKVSIWAFFVVLIGSIFLTACGGGREEPVNTIDVGMTEHTFTPNEFTVPAGDEITINLNNSGKQPHEFRILVLGAKADENVDKNGKSTRYWSNVAMAGENKSFSFTAPSEPGRYVIVCSAVGHAEAGMVGTLWVK
jgi:plastocyanin